MARKWLVRSAALVVLLTSVGCRSWCEHHYGQACCSPSYPAPQCCCPPQYCCPPTSSYSPPPPAPVPAGTWNQPRGCTCP